MLSTKLAQLARVGVFGRRGFHGVTGATSGLMGAIADFSPSKLVQPSDGFGPSSKEAVKPVASTAGARAPLSQPPASAAKVMTADEIAEQGAAFSLYCEMSR